MRDTADMSRSQASAAERHDLPIDHKGSRALPPAKVMGRAMHSYRLYFLNVQSAIATVAIILEAETDDAALLSAESTFREKGALFAGFELWEFGRRVHRHFKA